MTRERTGKVAYYVFFSFIYFLSFFSFLSKRITDWSATKGKKKVNLGDNGKII